MANSAMLGVQQHSTNNRWSYTKTTSHYLKDFCTGLWRFPLSNNNTTTNTIQPSPNHQTNSAHQTTTISTLIEFLRATAFSPVKSTWIKAIKRGFFQSWPGLTTTAVTKKYFLQSETTTKGHMDQTGKNAQSTKSKNNHRPTNQQEEENDPKQEIDNVSTQQSVSPPAPTLARYVPIKPDDFQSLLVENTNGVYLLVSLLSSPSS
jgi:hypothetical protein